MTASEVEALLESALDKSRELAERIRTVGDLAAVDDHRVGKALMIIAVNDAEPPELGQAAGRSLAAIHLRKGTVSAVALRDLTGPAYLGFDGIVADAINRRLIS